MTLHTRGVEANSEPGDLSVPLSDLLKPSQVCRLLNVSRTWLFEATRDGRIPSVRLGEDGPVRYDPEELVRWLYDRRS